MIKPNPPTNPYSYFSQSNPPIKIATQETNKSAVQETTPPIQEQPKPQTSISKPKQDTKLPQQTPSFSQAIKEAKTEISNINSNAVYNMSEADAIKYTKNSIADLEQKMAKVASLISFGNTPPQQTQPQQPIAASNTQVQNTVSNVTNITSDYLRNIRGEYQKIPQWRSETG